MIYNTLILSHLNYGILCWGHSCDRILKLQKKAVRIIKLKSHIAHTEPLFKDLKLLRIDHILELQQLKFYYKYQNNLLPHYLQNLPFHHHNEIHDHNTRLEQEMRPALVKHTFAEKSLRYTIPQIINETARCILDKVNTHSLDGISRYIKSYYIENYETRCKKKPCYTCDKTLSKRSYSTNTENLENDSNPPGE